MRIVIIGAGEVGYQLAQRLSEEGQDVVIIEADPERAEQVAAQLDVLTITGNGASLPVARGGRHPRCPAPARGHQQGRGQRPRLPRRQPLQRRLQAGPRQQPGVLPGGQRALPRAPRHRPDDQPGAGVRLGDVPAAQQRGRDRPGAVRRRCAPADRAAGPRGRRDPGRHARRTGPPPPGPPLRDRRHGPQRRDRDPFGTERVPRRRPRLRAGAIRRDAGHPAAGRLPPTSSCVA